jgi:YhcH/YjgK/YiaL family protein
VFIGTLSGSYDVVTFSPRVQAGIDWIRNTDFSQVEDGVHEIDGRNLFAIVQSYTTKPESEGFWEAHRKYVDVQHVISGQERFGYAPLESLTADNEYDDKRDFQKFSGPDGLFVELRGEVFVVAEPSDAHMPEIELCGCAAARKVVIKARI